MLFTIDAVLLAIAAIAVPLAARAEREDRGRAAADAAAKLAHAGLQATGDLLGCFVVHPLEGRGVVVTNRTRHMHPGAKPPGDEVCLALLDVPLVDQIVCRAAEADAVMGPLPAVPRLYTGHAPFDAEYVVFVGVTGRAQPAGSYRASPVAGDVPWALPEVLDRFIELGISWMRVRDGHAELAFAPLEIEDVGRAAALALAFEQIARGGSVPALVRGPRLLRPKRVRRLELGNWFGAVPLAALVGIPLALLLAALGVDAELLCGPGHEVVWRSTGRGANLSCSTWEQHLGMYYLACVLLATALILLIVAGIVAKQTVEARTETEA